jgi:hypothetical protein
VRLVILESPYAGEIRLNLAYAHACMRDCLERNEAPFASHALYTLPGVLDDSVSEERTLGIEAGLAWGRMADATVVYVDRSISKWMRQGIERAVSEGRAVEVRSLYGDSAALLSGLAVVAEIRAHGNRPEIGDRELDSPLPLAPNVIEARKK